MNNIPKHKWSIEAKQRLKKFRTTPEYIESVSGKNSPSWKGGISKTNKTSYDAVKKRFPLHIPVRRDPFNRYVLQTKCMQCSNWFSPNGKVTNKKLIGKKPLNFFCSIKCSDRHHKKGKYREKTLIIKTNMYNELVKRNKELRKVNKKIKLDQKRELNKIKQLELKREKIEYNKKYGKMVIKRKRKEQRKQNIAWRK